MLNFALKSALILLLILSCTKNQDDVTEIDLHKTTGTSDHLIDMRFENSYKASTQKLNIFSKKLKREASILGRETIPPFSSFMFEKPISIYHNEIEMILVNQKVSADTGDVSYGLTFLNHKFGFDNFLIVKTINHSETKKEAHFLSPKNGQILLSMSFDSKTENISVISHLQNNSRNTIRSLDYDCEASWGQNTAACLQDVYTNHGWLSIWVTVQTAFLPQTAAALAAACAIDAYNPYDGEGCYTNGRLGPSVDTEDHPDRWHGNNDEDEDNNEESY